MHGVGAVRAAQAPPRFHAACRGARAFPGDAGDRCAGDADRGRLPARTEQGPIARVARDAQPSRTFSRRASTSSWPGSGATPGRGGPDGSVDSLGSHLSRAALQRLLTTHSAGDRCAGRSLRATWDLTALTCECPQEDLGGSSDPRALFLGPAPSRTSQWDLGGGSECGETPEEGLHNYWCVKWWVPPGAPVGGYERAGERPLRVSWVPIQLPGLILGSTRRRWGL